MSAKFRDQVADLFKSHPNEWLDGMTIAEIGGCYASRTRISECRTQLGMTIENRVVRRANGSRKSEYRYVPALVPSQPDLFARNAGGRAA